MTEPSSARLMDEAREVLFAYGGKETTTANREKILDLRIHEVNPLVHYTNSEIRHALEEVSKTY